MIEAQIIRENNKPKMVVLEYEEDRNNYYTALETKLTNKLWIKHEDIKKELGIQ